MRRLLILVPAALATCAAIIVPTASGAASRAEYVAAAEPICSSASADIRSLTRKFRTELKHGTDKQAGRVLTQTGDVFGRSVSQVRQITPPPGDEQTISNWLGMLDQVAANTRRMGKAQAHRKFGTRDALYLKDQEIGSNAIALVNEWGFKACTGSNLPALGPIPHA
jgi:hypothetical protein